MKQFILSATLLLSGSLYAQNEPDTLDANLCTVEITANRGRSTFQEAARKVTVITRAEIEQAPVQTVNELLEYVANVDVRQRGQNGIQADISLRGASFEQTLILLNGIKITDPQTGHHSLNLPMALMDIERIEVLHGGASRVYGPNAFAGAINIITKNPKYSEATARLAGGEFGYNEQGASVTLAHPETSHSHQFSILRNAGDGFMRNTDFEQLNLFWQSEVDLKKGNAFFNLGQNEKAFGSQNFYSTRYPHQFEETKTQFASVGLNTYLTKNNRIRVSPRAHYRRHYDRFELFREGEGYYSRIPGGGFASNEGDTVTWYTGHNYHRTDVYGAEISANAYSKLGVTSFGYEYRYEGVVSNALGEDLDTPENVVNEHPSAQYTKAINRENISYYLEHNFTVKKLFVSAGVMYNVNTAFGEEFFPGVDASYSLTDVWSAYGSVNRSFRMPSFTDLYYNLGGAVGSEDLMPEESINYEGGFKYTQKMSYGHVAYFRREGKNLIDWIRFAGSDTTRAANLTEVTINGLEADVNYNLEGVLGENFPLKRVSASYMYLWADTASTNFESNYVLDFLQHKADVGLHFKFGSTLFLDYQISYQDRVGEFTNAQGDEEAYEPVLLSDIRVGANYENLNVFIAASNLFNVRYNDIGNVQQPGRWVKLGATVKFPW